MRMNTEEIYNKIYAMPLSQLLLHYPMLHEFLQNYRLEHINTSLPFPNGLNSLNTMPLEDFEMSHEDAVDYLHDFILAIETDSDPIKIIQNITIQGGYDKSGNQEVSNFTIQKGEIISIVGPTGSGKSRLLADIECIAQGDTPTKRNILINNSRVKEETRFELGGNLVAQLSQNMNFIMDLSVHEFLQIHASCRNTQNPEQEMERCFEMANELSGEKFGKTMKVTQLSGGQSRALMIADAACISQSPILLIDEIENAGIEKMKAINLLTKEDKIIFLSTHDPLLALYAGKRIILKNGGISKIRVTSEDEKIYLKEIVKMDNQMTLLRERLRHGESCLMNLEV